MIMVSRKHFRVSSSAQFYKGFIMRGLYTRGFKRIFHGRKKKGKKNKKDKIQEDCIPLKDISYTHGNIHVYKYT